MHNSVINKNRTDWKMTGRLKTKTLRDNYLEPFGPRARVKRTVVTIVHER